MWPAVIKSQIQHPVYRVTITYRYYKARTRNLKIKYCASLRSHHFKPALLSRQSWPTWYSTHLKVIQALASSPASFMLLASCLVCRLAGAVWFPFFLFAPWGLCSFTSPHTIINKHLYQPRMLWRRHVIQNWKHVPTAHRWRNMPS